MTVTRTLVRGREQLRRTGPTSDIVTSEAITRPPSGKESYATTPVSGVAVVTRAVR
jgi:hypothetical protein